MVSKSCMFPRLVLMSQGSSTDGSRMRGKSKNRRAFTGLDPAIACTKYWRVKASPKVMRMPYSTGLSMRPVYIGVRNSRSNVAPRAKTIAHDIAIASRGVIPGSQTAVM